MNMNLQMSRRLIFGAYAILALSTAIATYNFLSQSGPGGIGASFDSQMILDFTSTIFAASGWWFLCQLQAKDAVQRSVLSKAYLFLGLEFSALCIVHLLTGSGVVFVDRQSAPFWITSLGFAVGAIGFLSTSYSTRTSDIAPVDAPSDRMDDTQSP